LPQEGGAVQKRQRKHNGETTEYTVSGKEAPADGEIAGVLEKVALRASKPRSAYSVRRASYRSRSSA